MLPEAESYDELCRAFRWQVPRLYNIGVDVCDKWAERAPNRVAIIEVRDDGPDRLLSFAELRALSNQTANLLAAHGIGRGDRVGIFLPQAAETAYSHIAVLKLGGIAIPLFTLFGEEALAFRLGDAGARAVITDAQGAAKLAAIRGALPALQLVFSIDGPAPGALDFHAGRRKQSQSFAPVLTHADDPALIIYTSGTTGPPKGALHAHRVLLGHLPGVEMAYDFFPQQGDRIWTPADWAWIGGLLDVLMPALHHGVTVVAKRFSKFTGEAAFELIARYGVRNAFLPPTALKMMRAVEDAEKRWPLHLRTVASGGETLGAELLDWGRRVLGVTINEFYGQTECNVIVSACGKIMAPRPGVMGRPVPGHEVAVIGEDGNPCADGELGMIAVRRGSPVMFLGYWQNEAATRAKFRGDWLITGDQGIRDTDGWLRFVGRDDDIITSSGYRIGPGEIEECLMKHPAVAMVGVVGVPDPVRTEIVKAFVQLRPEIAANDALKAELANFVKTRLAAHEYPREVEFVAELPLTTTGKIMRRELRRLDAARKAEKP
jgi:acetyl-CoA synthetase